MTSISVDVAPEIPEPSMVRTSRRRWGFVAALLTLSAFAFLFYWKKVRPFQEWARLFRRIETRLHELRPAATESNPSAWHCARG